MTKNLLPEERDALLTALDRLSNAIEMCINLFVRITDNFKTYAVMAAVALLLAALGIGMSVGFLIGLNR